MPTIEDIRLDAIEPSPLNPRREFAEAAMQELAASLAASGLIQPIVVRPIGPTRYSLLAGERRWRAAHLAGWETIPAVIREEEDDAQALAVMLAENLQREDLTPIEQARAFQRLQELKVSQTEIARRTGKSQPTIANTLRLLQLPEAVQARVQSRELSPASARALLPLAPFPEVAAAMAERAIAEQIPSKTLERDPLATREWTLAAAGIVRALDDRTPWVWGEVCRRDCPHGAYREAAGARGGVCLRPDHYDELLAEAGESEPVPITDGPAPVLRSTPDEAEREQRGVLWRDCRRLLEDRNVLQDERMVALLALDIVAGTKHETLKSLALEEPIPEELLAVLFSADLTRPRIAAILAEYPAPWVAKLAVLCLLKNEAEDSAHYRHPARLAEWLTAAPDDGPVAQRLSELLAPDAAA